MYGIKSLSQDVLPLLQSVIFDLNFTPNEFDSFDEVRGLFEGGIKLPTDIISQISPLPALKEILRTDGEQALKFPPPQVIRGTLFVLIKPPIVNMFVTFTYYSISISNNIKLVFFLRRQS
jgi:hypothetical protein